MIEDHSNGDVFACLPDGTDRNLESDSCVKMMSVRDQSAEPSGFGFSGDGWMAIVSIPHSNDDAIPEIDDYGTDDIVLVTGFRMKKNHRYDQGR